MLELLGHLRDCERRYLERLELMAFEREPRLVALRHPAEYPFNEGRIVSSDGLDLAPWAWDEAFVEEQVEGSNALHARTKDGGVYLLGPAARISLDADRLHPIAAEALAETGLADRIRTNIFWSIAARAIELLHACAEARDLVDAYVPPGSVLDVASDHPMAGGDLVGPTSR
ncbi:MAG: hypothetical protein K6U08_03070, partial [Firmicutes bacterium]|nr:hypothetical protein [Bacillota bacterium]